MQGIVRSSNASKMTRNQLAVPSSFAASIPRLPRVLRPVVKSPLALVLVAIGLLQSSAEAVIVYNANFGSDTITSWDTQGPYVATTFLSGVVDPVGVAVDPSGNVYVTQFGSNGTIGKYDATGSFLSSIDNLGYLPYSIRFDPAGTLYVADLNGSVIRRYTDTLSPLSNWATTAGSPTSIQFTPQGFVLVANAGTGNNAQKFSLSGVSLQTIGSAPTLDQPHDAVTAPSGDILVASRGTNAVVKYDSAGSLLDADFISGFDPYSILVDGSTLFVAAHDLGTIRRYNAATGAFLGDFAVGSLPTYMAVNPAAVPEPSACVMLAIAGAAGALTARRRLQAAASTRTQSQGRAS
jgi:DNA-binding beta-propeller fold protein YncE